ncbi:MAG TPA: response regulator [Sphingobium sp.]
MSSPLKILYVDDEEDIRTIVTLCLGMDPAMEVKTADSGIAALDLLTQSAWRPDLALVDVMMPYIDGIELLNRMRAEPDTAHIPVVFITASARSTQVKHYTDAGAIGIISKPFDPLTLAATVRGYHDGA